METGSAHSITGGFRLSPPFFVFSLARVAVGRVGGSMLYL